MDQQSRMAKQIMDLQRATFEGMINNMIMFWDQTGKMLSPFVDQAPWVPEEGKKAFRDWVEGAKKGCETFKNSVNDGFSRVESCFAANWQRQDSESAK